MAAGKQEEVDAEHDIGANNKTNYNAKIKIDVTRTNDGAVGQKTSILTTTLGLPQVHRPSPKTRLNNPPQRNDDTS